MALDEKLIRDITIKVLREMAAAKDMGSHSNESAHILRPHGEIKNPGGASTMPNNHSGAGIAIPIGVSARHVHLCRGHMDILFGPASELTFHKELMGGQYAAAESVTIVGKTPDTILKARVLGPLRTVTQVEISATDGRALGINPPLRDSGNISGSAQVTLIGPCGAIHLGDGCILARRHIHMSPADAQRYGVKDNDVVDVQMEGPRGGIFSNVLVRVDASFTLEMHIDTDEANAFGITTGHHARIIGRGTQ